jgi:hypothetical protein
MAKFVYVKEAPKELRAGEILIDMPTFLEEIRANANKAGRGGLTGSNHLRSIVGSIGQKYDENLTAWAVRPHLYEGRAFANEQQLSDIVVSMLQEQYPAIFEKYLEHQIKNRPVGTKLIYYVGRFGSASPFFSNGIDLIEEKDVDAYLGLKPKKVVGRPALTKEEAEQSTKE